MQYISRVNRLNLLLFSVSLFLNACESSKRPSVEDQNMEDFSTVDQSRLAMDQLTEMSDLNPMNQDQEGRGQNGEVRQQGGCGLRKEGYARAKRGAGFPPAGEPVQTLLRVPPRGVRGRK